MYEIRFHGRGGQGAVMAAQALAEAAVLEGYYAQAFPYFGAERRGAPVRAFARIDESKISIKSQVYEPDALVILDESILEIDPISEGLKPDGKAIINTVKKPEEVDLGIEVECGTVDATTIALETIKAPIVNTSILGAFARVVDIVPLESILNAIMNRFGEKLGHQSGVMNAEAARIAYHNTVVGRCKGTRTIVRKKVWLPAWDEIPIGNTLSAREIDGIAVGPGSMAQNLTGTWRTQTPRYSKEKCIRCLRCWFSCPEGCIERQEDDYERWDYRYCKGCGICAEVCPADAIEMVRGVYEW
ncbi:MAG: 2-oxoacid:acceptor oxidoreductase family protein [Methanomassiliicoccales archaeon]|nr:2-oxoacid:acceptor oxidoreductase family protein [Methanomassiliicoccales archaeon]